MIRAVILAGGEGTRLRPLTYATPKSLLPIANIPFLQHQLWTLARHGITTATLLTGYLADAFDPFIDAMAAEGIMLDVSREEQPLGTCGAVRSIRDRLDGTTIVFNGDVLTDLDLTEMLAAHRARGAALSIALKPVADAGPYGLVPTDDRGRVEAFLEKPPPPVAALGGNINAGTYVLEPDVLDDVPSGTPWSFERQLFPALVEAGAPVYGFVSPAYWLDIGTPERYRQAHWDLIDGKSSSFRPADFDVRGGCVLVGRDCTVAPDAVLGPRASFGNGCVIEAGATVRGSVLLDDVRIGEGATIVDAILGAGFVARAGDRIQDSIRSAE